MTDAPYAIRESIWTAIGPRFGVLPKLDAPSVICKIKYSCNSAVGSCFGVLSMVHAPCAICKTNLLAAAGGDSNYSGNS